MSRPLFSLIDELSSANCGMYIVRSREMNRIVSIGIVGLGWLGKSLGEALAADGFRVWGTVRAQEKANQLNSTSALSVHCWSAQAGVSSLEPSLAQTDLLIITLPPSGFDESAYLTIIGALIEKLDSSSKVIYTSSTGVYQNIDGWQKEDSDLLSDSLVAKADEFIRKSYGDRTTVLRLGGLIGSDRNPVKYLAKKEVNYNPDEPVHLIHRKDIISVVKKIINEKAFGDVYNVVNPERPTRKTYYSAMAAQLGYSEPRFTTEKASKGKQIDTNKLEKELEFNTFTPLLPE